MASITLIWTLPNSACPARLTVSYRDLANARLNDHPQSVLDYLRRHLPAGTTWDTQSEDRIRPAVERLLREHTDERVPVTMRLQQSPGANGHAPVDDGLRRQLTECRGQLAQAQGAVDRLKGQAESLGEALRRNQADVQRLQASVIELTARNQELARYRKSLAARMEVLQAERDQYVQKLNECTRAYQDLRNRQAGQFAPAPPKPTIPDDEPLIP